MRAFFACLHLEPQVGGAPSTLRAVMEPLAPLIVETTEALEREGIAQGPRGPMVGSVDATFLERLMLVCMDLVRGDIVCEEGADDRTSETWSGRVKARRAPMQTRVVSLVSDRAQALITLAETGLECPSIPEVFPLLYALVKGDALAISRQWQAAHQALSHAQAHRDKLQASGTSEPEPQAAQSAVAACEAAVSHWEQGRETSRAHLTAMSLPVFPWRVTDSTPQTSHEVAAHLTAEVAAIQAWLATKGLPVQQQVLGKVRPQLAGLAGGIDLGWQEVRQGVQSQMVLTPRWANWVEAHWLPLMSWEQQGLRTRCPRRTAKLCEALEAVRAALEAHPLTAQLSPEVFVGWQAWAADDAKLFQRASSAVEGRQGSLSQMHHNHRGLPQRRSKVWSALHTLDGRASDGSTPASRFFRREFPDLFETV